MVEYSKSGSATKSSGSESASGTKSARTRDKRTSSVIVRGTKRSDKKRPRFFRHQPRTSFFLTIARRPYYASNRSKKRREG